MMDKKNRNQTRDFRVRAAINFLGDITHDIAKNKMPMPDVKAAKRNGGTCGVQLTNRAENDHMAMAK